MCWHQSYLGLSNCAVLCSRKGPPLVPFQDYMEMEWPYRLPTWLHERAVRGPFQRSEKADWSTAPVPDGGRPCTIHTHNNGYDNMVKDQSRCVTTCSGCVHWRDTSAVEIALLRRPERREGKEEE